jgi:hypothetical protein
MIVSVSRRRVVARLSEARPVGRALPVPRKRVATATGASPTITVTTTRTAAMKSATGRLSATSSSRGMLAGAKALIASIATFATTRPPSAPSVQRTAASVRS